jgi:hypothetical protein
MMQLNRFRQREIISGQQSICSRSRSIFFSSYLVLGALFVPAVLMQPTPLSAQNVPVAQRVIRGKVYGSGDTPQKGAVVYLKNMKSLEIKTYIAQDATYRFGQLGTSEDYQLWAEFGGHKSKVKNISGFDSSKQFDVSLHIEDK